MEKATKRLGHICLPFLASNDNVRQFWRPFWGGRAVEEGDSGDIGPDFEGVGNVCCVLGQRNRPKEATAMRWPATMV